MNPLPTKKMIRKDTANDFISRGIQIANQMEIKNNEEIAKRPGRQSRSEKRKKIKSSDIVKAQVKKANLIAHPENKIVSLLEQILAELKKDKKIILPSNLIEKDTVRVRNK